MTQPTAASAQHPSSAAEPRPQEAAAVRRQIVNFAFYHLDPAFRRLGREEKEAAREEFLSLFRQKSGDLLCLTYSTVGLKAGCDLLVWRIGYAPEDVQAQAEAINRTRLGGYLTMPWSFVSMTKRSVYVDKIDPSHGESRTRIVPGKRKYLFIYPFVKTREWYLLPLEKRQAMMDTHIRVGNKYPSVKLNTTYSFGLDDQDFVVAFETDEPTDFVDLVMELRETEGSRYTQRDTPIFTCVQLPMERILQQLF